LGGSSQEPPVPCRPRQIDLDSGIVARDSSPVVPQVGTGLISLLHNPNFCTSFVWMAVALLRPWHLHFQTKQNRLNCFTMGRFWRLPHIPTPISAISTSLHPPTRRRNLILTSAAFHSSRAPANKLYKGNLLYSALVYARLPKRELAGLSAGALYLSHVASAAIPVPEGETSSLDRAGDGAERKAFTSRW